MIFTDNTATPFSQKDALVASNDAMPHPLRRAEDHAALTLARLLWQTPDGDHNGDPLNGQSHVQPNGCCGTDPLNVVMHWLNSHHITGRLEADGDGCWLHAVLSESDLLNLQNHVLLTLHRDVFIAYLKQGPDDIHFTSKVCWRNDIDQSARAAALILHTRPIACLHPAKASAIALFRRHANTNAIHFHEQPIWHLASGRPVGREMLARIKSISTADWISHVVESHDSITLAKLALAHAHEQLAITGDCYISVNLTASDFLHPVIGTLLNQWSPCKLKRLVLELTEWQNPSAARGLPRALEVLRDMGIRIAIDDFGAGYSSTVVLREIAFDIIKLDMSLVKSRRHSSRELIRWVTQCAQEMSASVVAEGIETQEDLASIMDLGIPYGQGWLLDQKCRNGGCDAACQGGCKSEAPAQN